MSRTGNPMVNVHSKLTVVSDAPVEQGKIYPLSILDHAMGLHTLHIIFYYRYDRSESEDLGRLRASLSQLLTLYPTVTGRLRRRSGGEEGNWEVSCNDAGVRVLVAKVHSTLDEWLRSADGSQETDLTVWEDMPEEDTSTWSPFRIQINDFKGEGLAIGLSCTHMSADPTCCTTFFKSWMEVDRGVSIAHPPFFHPPGLRSRACSNTNTITADYYATKSKSKRLSPIKMSTVTFRFSDKMIKQCLSDVQTDCPDATPFDVLAALFWSCAMRAKTPKHDKMCNLSICIDIRKLMHAPLPHGYFGNALHFSIVSAEASKIGEVDGLDNLAGLVHNHLLTLEEEEFWSAIDWLGSQRGGTPFRMYGPELTCVNMEHLFAYNAILENKKPLHVSYHVGNVEGEGLILILPSPEEGLGRTVILTLPEDQTDKLRKDPAILCLEPTMLVSGS